jgi:hypothetical protein
VFVWALVVAWSLHDPREVVGPYDPAYYWRMANGQVVSAPFGYRILVPSFVRALPLDHHVGFVFVTAVSMTVLCVAVWVWLHGYVSSLRAAAGAAIVLASGPVWWQFHSPYRTDAAMMALLALAALFSDERRWVAFAIVAVMAVAARDVAVIIAIVPLLAWRAERDHRALWALGAIVTTFLLVRGFVPVIPRPLQRPGDILHFRAAQDGGLIIAVFLAIAGSFGAAWFLVPAAWKRLDTNTKHWALVGAAAIPTLLIASDWSRLLAPAFPLICMSAVRSRVSTSALFVVAALTAYPNWVPQSTSLLLLTTATSGAVMLLWRDHHREHEASERLERATNVRT